MKHRKHTRGSTVRVVNDLTANEFVVNPFKSEAQRRACYAADDPAWDCKEWESVTPDNIPKRLSKRAKTKLARNNAKSLTRQVPIAKLDPSRTLGLRRQFNQRLRNQFNELKGRIITFVGSTDAFGLADRSRSSGDSTAPSLNGGNEAATANHQTQMRGADGAFGHGVGLGITRDDMPQIPTDKLDAFIQYARSQGVGVAEDTVKSSSLQPIQSEFRQERVDAIPDDVAARSPAIISSDSRILDGTHRWLKIRQRGGDGEMKVLRLGCDVDDAMDLMDKFTHTKYTENANPEGCNQYKACDEGLPEIEGVGRLPKSKEGDAYVEERDGSKRPVAYTSNPTKEEWRNLLTEHHHLRGLADHQGIIVWPEDQAYHEQVARALDVHGAAEFTADIHKDSISVNPRRGPWNWPENWDASHPYFQRRGFESDVHGTHLSLNSYKPFLCTNTMQMGWMPVELVEVPDIRQQDKYSCGAAATTSVLQFYDHHVNEDLVAKLLGTNVEKSTRPAAIIQLLQGFDLQVEARENMTLDDLSEYHRRGWPVIVCTQNYFGERDAQDIKSFGHYITVIGRSHGYVFAADPSLENWQGVDVDEKADGRSASSSQEQDAPINAPGRVMIRDEDFLKAWHDVDSEGKPYVQYGIAVGPEKDDWFVGNANPEGYNQYKHASGDTVEVSSKGDTHHGQQGTVVDAKTLGGQQTHKVKFASGKEARFGADELKSVAKAPKESLKDFASKVVEAAKKVPDAIGGHLAEGSRFSHKPLISDVHEAMKSDMPIDEFKGKLREAHDAHHITLERNDLPGAIQGDKVHERVTKSQIDTGHGLLHVILTNANPEGCNQHTGPGCSAGPSTGLSSHITAARQRLKDFQDKLDKATDVHGIKQVKAASKFLKDVTQRMYGKLESRYGRKTAAAILLSGQALGWGALGAGAAMGVPLWLPGSTLWGSLPAVAMAEAGLQAYRAMKRLTKNANPEGHNQYTGGAGHKWTAFQKKDRKRIEDSIAKDALPTSVMADLLKPYPDLQEKYGFLSAKTHHAAVHSAVEEVSKSLRMDAPVKDVYEAAKSKSPSMTQEDFKRTVGELYKAKRINVVPHSGTAEKVPEHAVSDNDLDITPDRTGVRHYAYLYPAQSTENSINDVPVDIHWVNAIVIDNAVMDGSKSESEIAPTSNVDVDHESGRVLRVLARVLGKWVKDNSITANAEETGDNCGTGSGGFQPGNTCGKGSGEVSFKGEKVDPTVPGIKREIELHIRSQLRDVATKVDKLRESGAKPEDFVGLHKEQQKILTSDLAKAVKYGEKSTDEKAAEETVAEAKPARPRAPKESRGTRTPREAREPAPSESTGSTHETVLAAQSGDKEAMAQVLRENHGMVHKLARKYVDPKNPNFDDLVSQGHLGVIRAVQKFDATKKTEDGEPVKFGTYAHHWIHRNIRREAAKFAQQGKQEKSIDVELKSEEGGRSRKSIEPVAKPETDTAEGHDRVNELRAAMDKQLLPRERDILERRLGMGGHEPHTQEEVARFHGVTAMRVSQIEKAAHAKLKKVMSENALQLVENVLNANPEGCNQFTGPGCSVGEAPVEDKVAKAAANFVVRWSWGGNKGEVKSLPNIAAEELLKQSRPKSPITLYRFERSDHDPSKGQMSSKIPLQAWTKSKETAEGVAGAMNEDPEEPGVRYVVKSQTFHPHEVYTDFSNLHSKVNEHVEKLGGHSGMDEVLVYRHAVHNTVANTVHAFVPDAAKIEAFQQWLRDQLGELVQGKSQEQLWRTYIHQGFVKGAGRAFDDTKKPFTNPRYSSQVDPTGLSDFYRGSREEFLRGAFGQPVAKEKVELLASRSFDELENVTSDMSNKMSRVLTDGLVEGKSPHDVARDMVGEVDISRGRAEVVARTELLRAHASGQLMAMKQMGVHKLGVAVEWTVAGAPCERCSAMEGVVLDLDNAEGLLPLHPNCTCVFTPANVGEDDEDQITDADEIQDAFDEAGIDRKANDAPDSIFNAYNERGWTGYTWNMFCPTGPGGGVDPTCGKEAHASIAAMKHYHVAHWLGQQGYSHEQIKSAMGKLGLKATDQVIRFQMKTPKRNIQLTTDQQNYLHGLAKDTSGKVVSKVDVSVKPAPTPAPKPVPPPAPKPPPVKPAPPPTPPKEKPDAGRTIDRGRSERDEGKPAPASPRVAPAPEQPSRGSTGGERTPAREPAGEATAARVPADVNEIHSRITDYEQKFNERGEHELGKMMSMLREHVEAHGAAETLQSLGKELKGGGHDVKYEGEYSAEEMPQFCKSYLERHGVSIAERHDVPLMASMSPKFHPEGPDKPAYGVQDTRGGFQPHDPTLKDKLAESKALPGLEKSEDLGKLMGRPVTHLSGDVTDHLDKTYGKGQWIVKPYTEDAYAGHGIYFPQKAERMKEDAKATIRDAETAVAPHGFSVLRDKGGTAVGLKHESGDEYHFGTDRYHTTLYGDVRNWGDRVAKAAQNERGPALLDREGNINGGSYMAQPAFKAVGVSDADRASGTTIAPGEGRVHVITRDGKAEVVPHSTWIKKEHLPVVLENDDTRAMAKAAVDAINALPHSEKQGQIYAPDILKSEKGYRVVEANPANDTGSSGYLGNNPFIIDSYVSHLTGREPAHVQFMRDILSKNAGGEAGLKRLERMMAKNFLWTILLNTGNTHLAANRFCPTGTGGGVDATCGKDEGGGGGGTSTGKVKVTVVETATPATEHPETCPPPCDRPSKPGERTPGKPVALPWRPPPPKKKKDPNAPKRPSGEDSQTKMGDLAEDLATNLGFRKILPEGKRSFTAAEVKKKGSSIDLELGFTGKLYELKMCATTSTEYRLKAKEKEKNDKLKYAKKVQGEANTLIGVHDKEAGTIHFYAAKQPGLVGAEVSEKTHDFVGVVQYTKE